MVGRVYTNCIICKHLGQVGVTKEHIMSANAIICTQLWGVGAHHVPKCYYLHAFKGVGAWWCKQFGKLGVTKEHLMCANAVICTYARGG